MPSSATLLLPDFLLIAIGFAVCRWTALGRPVWDAAERLVYHLLFPVLLFTSVLRSPLQPAQTAALALAGIAVVGSGIVLAMAVGRLPGVDARLHASGAQTAFRFTPSSPWRWPSGWAARRGSRGWRCWSRSACRSPTSPRSGRWRATAATPTAASCCATR